MKNNDFGSELECFLAYNLVTSEWLGQIVHFIKYHGLSFFEEKALLCYGEDYIIPQIIASDSGLKELLSIGISFSSFKRLILNCRGQFTDVISPVSITMELDINVVSLSVPEGFIWNFQGNRKEPKIERLLEFANLCKSFAMQFPPKYSTVSNFGIHAEDFSVSSISEERKNEALYNEQFLSRDDVENLYNWYINDYLYSIK